MKKIFSLLLVLVLSFSLFSCKEKNRTYDEGEVKAAAADLIERSKVLNLVYWGTGIEYVENDNTSNGYYYEANILHLEKLGFKTIEELRTMTLGVFSAEYSEIIFASSLSSVSDEDGIHSLARYYQKYLDKEMKEPDTIMVYSRAKVLLTDEVVYLYETLEVEGSVGEVVYVNLKVSVTRDEKTQIRSIRVGLIEQENGWRLNDATYITYDKEYKEN